MQFSFIFFQEEGPDCSLCVCRKFYQPYVAGSYEPSWTSRACCDKCVRNCPCGESHTGNKEYDQHIIVGCTPCGCPCTVERKYVGNGQFECGSCGSTCFPGTARLTLENGKAVSMSELQVGDRVQTGTVHFKLIPIKFPNIGS